MNATAPMFTLVVRRSFWRTLLLAALGLAVLGGLALAWALASIELPPVHVVIDGVEHGGALNLAAMPAAHKLVLALGVVFAAVAALMVVPVVMLAVAGVVLLGLLIGMGLPMLAVLAIVLAIASPLILLVLLVLWLLRRPARIGA